MTMMTRYDPAANMVSLREAMDQLFRDSFVTPFGRLAQTTANMPVDVYETGDAFVVKAFMPGLTADDLQINVQEQIVTIHGEPKAENPEGMRPLLQERWIGAFTRTFTLPVSVEPGGAYEWCAQCDAAEVRGQQATQDPGQEQLRLRGCGAVEHVHPPHTRRRSPISLIP
jgi:HSP20 family protein